MGEGAKSRFPGVSAGKESTHSAGDLGLILELGRSPGGGHGNPLQYSFFFFFNFNLRLIILQYCGGFAI